MAFFELAIKGAALPQHILAFNSAICFPVTTQDQNIGDSAGSSSESLSVLRVCD